MIKLKELLQMTLWAKTDVQTDGRIVVEAMPIPIIPSG